jgi:hypothetical protein
MEKKKGHFINSIAPPNNKSEFEVQESNKISAKKTANSAPYFLNSFGGGTDYFNFGQSISDDASIGYDRDVINDYDISWGVQWAWTYDEQGQRCWQTYRLETPYVNLDDWAVIGNLYGASYARYGDLHISISYFTYDLVETLSVNGNPYRANRIQVLNNTSFVPAYPECGEEPWGGTITYSMYAAYY